MYWDEFIPDETCEAKLSPASKHEEHETRDMICKLRHPHEVLVKSIDRRTFNTSNALEALTTRKPVRLQSGPTSN